MKQLVLVQGPHLMFDMNNLTHAYGKPNATATFKASPDDFKVCELLAFELSGAGEHQFLRIEKRGLNTEELVKSLARCLNKPVKSISYAGLKDRQALTTQWLSVHCPGEDIANASELEGSGWRVIDCGRHLKKLKIGGLSGNQFTVILRDMLNTDDIEERLNVIQLGGVPNYFGPQRFGHNGQNIIKAQDMLLKGVRVKDRFLRGIYYSAARSFLFNRILSERVTANTWNKALSGDVMQLGGTHSIFSIDTPDESIHARIASHDISPTAPLWGKGCERMSMDALISQQNALQGFEPWCDALEQHGLERMYRSHTLQVSHLTWDWLDAHSLALSFELVAGAYATSVLREVVNI